MEGIIILEGTVSELTGYRDGCVTVKLAYNAMKYRSLEMENFVEDQQSEPAFVDLPYRGAKQLKNPEYFGFSPSKQPACDFFGTPVAKLHSGHKITVYIHWKEITMISGSIERRMYDIVIVDHNQEVEQMQNMIERIADKLSA